MTGRGIRRESVDESGLALIITALVMVLALAFVALVIDLGNVRQVRRQEQSAADAGALAGAQDLPTTVGPATTAIDKAAKYAAATITSLTPTSTSCGAVVATACFTAGVASIRVTSPLGGNAQRIQVEVCQRVNFAFAQVIGQSSSNPCANAIGQVAPGFGPGPCALCLLGLTGTTLSSTGPGTLVVNNGNIAVNSSDAQAAKNTGPGSLGVAPSPPNTFGVHGGFSGGPWSPSPTTGAAIVPDPLASVPVPVIAGPLQGSVALSGSASQTISPGIWDSIRSSSTGQITLLPGLYVVRKEVTLNKSPSVGNTSLFAHGVMIYYACQNYPTPCASGEQGAGLTMTGGATYDMTPPASGPYAGMTAFFDRQSTAEFSLTGSSGSTLNGSLYLKSGQVSLTGPSGTFTLNAMIVANNLIKTGNSAIDVVFDPLFTFPIPGAGPPDVTLVG